MLDNNIVDYMIKECEKTYNLEGAKLIKKSIEDKRLEKIQLELLEKIESMRKESL